MWKRTRKIQVATHKITSTEHRAQTNHNYYVANIGPKSYFCSGMKNIIQFDKERMLNEILLQRNDREKNVKPITTHTIYRE